MYDLEGLTVDGQPIEAEATFSHIIPAGPVLLTPARNSVQNPANTIVSWQAVPNPAGGTIQAYQVIVTQQLNVLPLREFSVFVPASVTSVKVAPEFMQHGAQYVFEVLAIEAGGNQTLASSSFSTSP